jgi:hypothetical protein
MCSQDLQHRFSSLQQVRSSIVIHPSLASVEGIKPILLLPTLARVDEGLDEAVPDKDGWTSQPLAGREVEQGESDR